MTYASGTLAATANSAADLYTQVIAPTLTAAGFTLVDTVVISTRTHAMWKSAAANNSQGLDWYLDVAYTTTGNAGGIYFGVFESYDPATHLGYRGNYQVAGNYNSLETTYYSKYGATGYALETNWGTITANHLLVMPASAAAFLYWFSATADRVIAAVSTDPTRIVYSGFYAPDPDFVSAAGTLVYPLVSGSLASPQSSSISTNSSTTQGLALTRVPLFTSDVIGLNYAYLPVASFAGDYSGVPMGDVAGVTSTPVASAIGAIRGSEITLWGNPLSAGSGGSVYPGASQAFSSFRFGKAIDLLWFMSTSGVARGDTITIDGSTWVLTSYVATGTCLAFKAI